MSYHFNIGHKPREARRKVRIPVRILANEAWADMCLLDVSSRGLLIEGGAPPPRGTYVEVRRGRHVIVARVVWSERQRFGVHTQDRVAVGAITGEADDVPGADPSVTAPQRVERRVHPRALSPAEAHERSRMVGRLIEFGVMLVTGFGLALLFVAYAGEAIIKPLAVVGGVLN